MNGFNLIESNKTCKIRLFKGRALSKKNLVAILATTFIFLVAKKNLSRHIKISLKIRNELKGILTLLSRKK